MYSQNIFIYVSSTIYFVLESMCLTRLTNIQVCMNIRTWNILNHKMCSKNDETIPVSIFCFLTTVKDVLKGFFGCSFITMFPFLAWLIINLRSFFRTSHWWSHGIFGVASRMCPSKISSVSQQLHSRIRIQQTIFPHRDHFLCNLGDGLNYGMTITDRRSLLCSNELDQPRFLYEHFCGNKKCIAMVQQLGIHLEKKR